MVPQCHPSSVALDRSRTHCSDASMQDDNDAQTIHDDEVAEYVCIEDAGEEEPCVRVDECDLGHGVFARREFALDEVIGEITGNVIEDPTYGSNYAIDLEDGRTLEPLAPFRFLNHSCDANCEFTFFDVENEKQELADSGETPRFVFLVALEKIRESDELTIDYNWPAEAAVRCHCHAPNCRGWIVAEEEVGLLEDM
jgi:uncharacterized protein